MGGIQSLFLWTGHLPTPPELSSSPFIQLARKLKPSKSEWLFHITWPTSGRTSLETGPSDPQRLHHHPHPTPTMPHTHLKSPWPPLIDFLSDPRYTWGNSSGTDFFKINITFWCRGREPLKQASHFNTRAIFNHLGSLSSPAPSSVNIADRMAPHWAWDGRPSLWSSFLNSIQSWKASKTGTRDWAWFPVSTP